ncbi:hypothetical protein CO174_01570 [Candidatus Uhrbacteria bacterium CG_4_9_14_3_um_filter_50_9]|uniref:Glutamine amidotransferase domain-containing protein n=1 Tax=Candidatus Uhrbacteria bacterium CG_4_9_14_3_um_filter_50_9 TaxID=1975035 RepID=A0A2M7XD30_9BACT|nr:MAG: hypothetical protein CO174_01570 [Candidatus Uhrbacteria bacterium CG_4_9_14_3_um_filter_50_9]
MKRIVICQYAPGRALAFKQWLPEALVIERHNGEPVPDSFDAIIFGGGPMSADEAARKEFPFLEEDLQLIQQLAHEGERAPLSAGICLGAQMIALALGGDVAHGPTIRGWNQIVPIEPHALFPDHSCIQFEFHSNHIRRLPEGAVLLASSNHDKVEAFRVGTGMWATAYHPEVTRVDAERIYTGAGLEPNELHNDQFEDPGIAAFRSSQMFFEGLFAER